MPEGESWIGKICAEGEQALDFSYSAWVKRGGPCMNIYIAMYRDFDYGSGYPACPR